MANSTRKCKQCGEYRPAGLGVKLPAGWFCSMDHAIEFAREKSAKVSERKARAESRQRKMDVKPIGYWMKRAQAAFNAYIRARDAGLPCVSCGHPDDGSRQRHASHFRSVGACSSLRFDEKNVHASCSICNNWLSGNIGNYRVELERRIGSLLLSEIESAPKLRKWSKDDLIEIEKYYKSKLKKLLESRNDKH